MIWVLTNEKILGKAVTDKIRQKTQVVSAKRRRKRISPLPATVEVKLRNRNEQLPHWPNEAFSCLPGLENTKEI
jgi:hypothetical protein